MPILTRAFYKGTTLLFPENTAVFNSTKTKRNNTIELPGLTGSYDVYQGGIPYDSEGRLQVTIYYVGEGGSYDDRADDLEAQLTELYEIGNFGTMILYASFEGEQEERWCFAQLSSIDDTQAADDSGEIYVAVDLNFIIPDARWYTLGTEAPIYGTGVAYGGGAYYGGTVSPQALSGALTEFTINNVGNATTLVRLLVECGSGQAITSVIIQRIQGAAVVDELNYASNLVANDTLELNCRSQSVLLNGVDAYGASFSYLRAGWFTLQPGTNNIRVILGDPGDAGTIKVIYYNAYRR